MQEETKEQSMLHTLTRQPYNLYQSPSLVQYEQDGVLIAEFRKRKYVEKDSDNSSD